MTCLDEISRLEYLTTISQGIVERNGKPLVTQHSSDEESSDVVAFVIGPDETLYSGAHSVNRFHHSSFLAGAQWSPQEKFKQMQMGS